MAFTAIFGVCGTTGFLLNGVVWCLYAISWLLSWAAAGLGLRSEMGVAICGVHLPLGGLFHPGRDVYPCFHGLVL